jgi:F-type H+-transporting ATPase subunit delta
MEAASRESYLAALERLDGFVTGQRPVPLAGVADEILAVATLLERQPGLRRALSDPSRSGADRAELLGSLVHGKVSEDTEALLRTLVAGRWSSSGALLNAVERLGADALLASADSAGELAEVEDELFRFGQLVNGHNDLAAALGTSTTPVAQRCELAHGLLRGKASSATVRLVDLALRGFGGRNFTHSLTRLVELAAERRDRQVAYVTVARTLTDEDEFRLGARLAQMCGRQVALKVSVEPRILGGVSVRIGHDLYDGTVLRRINETRAALAGRH